MRKKHSLAASFRCAFTGIFRAFQSERNMKIHGICTVLVILFGILFRIALWEWALCLTQIGAVIGAEMLNTAIETVVDMAMPEHNELAGKAKDIAAGAVLFTAICAAIIGALIFLPKILALFFR